MKHALYLGAFAFGLLVPVPAQAGEVPAAYRETVSKGLEWLAKNQNKDGSWTATGGQYPTPITALAGLALVAEGSTTSKGKYADNIRRAVDWLVARSQANGLIGIPPQPRRPFPPMRPPAGPPADPMPAEDVRY